MTKLETFKLVQGQADLVTCELVKLRCLQDAVLKIIDRAVRIHVELQRSLARLEKELEDPPEKQLKDPPPEEIKDPPAKEIKDPPEKELKDPAEKWNKPLAKNP